MNLETKDYKGKCRRKLSYNDILRIVGSCVVVIFIAGGIAWQVKSLADDSKTNKKVDKKQNDDIIILTSNDKHHTRQLEEYKKEQRLIKKKVDNSNETIHLIWGRMNGGGSSRIIDLPYIHD